MTHFLFEKQCFKGSYPFRLLSSRQYLSEFLRWEILDLWDFSCGLFLLVDYGIGSERLLARFYFLDVEID